MMRVALLYEHPTWSQQLISRAHDREITFTPIDVGSFDFVLPHLGSFDLWINRVNAMPSAGRSSSIVAATGHLLLALEVQGERVVNGATSHRVGASKAAQTALFGQLGLATPASTGIFAPSQAVDAAVALGFPVLTKPNVGGSGSGIVRHDSIHELRAALDAGLVDLGIDGTGLVQKIIEPADGLIHRVEMLGSTFFYGTEQPLQADAFNYCATDGCAVEPGGTSISVFQPPDEIIAQAAQVMNAASTDVGGVEYIIDATTGQPTFYDFNPYSNFVSGLDDKLGFDPIERYLDHVLALGG